MKKNILALDEIKKHLNIDECYLDDDSYIISLLYAAQDAAEIHLRRKLKDNNERPSILQGIKFLIGHWYRTRENVSNITVNEIPYTFKYLMDLNRSYKKTY